MSVQEQNAYILGTDAQELFRLGIQHEVWAEETAQSWQSARFRTGQTLLDLGCGPGFCTKELAFLAGTSGKVIGIDRSAHYIQHLQQVAKLHHLNVEAIAADFNDMQLPASSLDGMYCRWALAWLPNPKDILYKVYQALKTGGRMVIHEYYDWSTHQTEPSFPALSKAIAAALQSFHESAGNINIGRLLPQMLQELGMQVVHTRPMAKLTRPNQPNWAWPKSFYESYFPRLVDLGYLSESDVSIAMQDLAKLEAHPGASLFCPMMVEVIAEKV